MRLGVKKKLALVVLLLPFCRLASAQNTGATETKTIYLKITSAYKRNDTVTAILDKAADIGLQDNQLIKAYQSNQEAIPGVREKRDLREVASGRIVIAGSEVKAVVVCYNKADTLGDSDLVSLRLNVPVLPYRSVFSDIAFNDIIFGTRTRKPLYNLQDIVNHDNKRLEDSIYEAITSDLHETYQVVKDRVNLPKQLREKVSAGRFKDRVPLEVIRDVTRKEIEAFLLYCNTYPAGYMGKDYRASESFLGWVTSNSPYSQPEVKNALFPIYKNKTAFAQALPVYKKDIIAEGMVKSLGEDAVGLSDELNFKEAHELLDFALALAEAVNDTSAKPYAHLHRAQFFLDQEKYTESIDECDKAVAAALQAHNKVVELQATIKKGLCLYKVSKYAAATRALEEAQQKLAAYQSSISPDSYNSSRQRIYEYKADILYESGEYKKALVYLDTAIQVNGVINSYDAQLRNAAFFTFIGKVNNEKGYPAEALTAFNKAIRIYKNNSDVKNTALLENQIGNSYYKLRDYRKGMEFADAAQKKLLAAEDYNNAGYSSSLKGNCYWGLGQFDSAVALHHEAITFRKKSNNAGGEAYSWSLLGELYLLSGHKTTALNAFDSSIRLYQYLKDSAGLADEYNEKGQVYLNDESYKKAADLFETAKGINRKADIEALFKLGDAWNYIDTIKAKKYYIDARELSKNSDNAIYQFSAIRALAQLAFRSHDINEGEKLYNEYVALAKQLNTPQAQTDCLSLNAQRFESKTQLDSALVYYWKAFKASDKNGSVWQLNNIANVYISQGEFEKANSAMQEAIAIATATSNSLALGSVLQNSSFLCGLTAAFDKGMRNNDSAIAIFSKSGNMVRMANTYLSRGVLLDNMGEYSQAVRCALFADSIFKDELLMEDRLTVFNNIGNIYNAQLDYATALQYLQRAAALLKPGVVTETYLLIQGNIAECLFNLKRYKDAKVIYLDILPKAQKLGLNRIVSGMALILGKLYFEEQQLPDAKAYLAYAKALAINSGEKDDLVEALIGLGRINKQQQQTDSAIINFRVSVNLVKAFKIVNWMPFYELGLMFYDQKKFDSAIVYFKQSIAMLDKSAEKLYGGAEAKKIFNNDPAKSDMYNKITFANYYLGNLKDAWAYANRSNIAGIRELSGNLAVNSEDKEKNEALRKLLAMQESKKALEKTLEKQEGTAKNETLKKIEILNADYDNFVSDLLGKYPDLNSYFSNSNADEFSTYKGNLPGDLAVALYLMNGNTLMIFTLTNEKLAVDTMRADNIIPTITKYIQAIKNTENSTGTGSLSVRSEPQDEEKAATAVDFKNISDELYNVLIGSINDNIKNKKKLCIIPSGIFSNIPFQCLGKKMPDSSFRFLIEDKSIFYTNKMSVFTNLGKSGSTDAGLASFAAFGVPDATLRYNITEVQNIGKILGADSTIYADSRATESMAKHSLLTKKYIHFATHGVLQYSSDFSLSYLKLLPDKDTSNGNNGQLTLREIQTLDLNNCDMVILSACQTAVSKELVVGWNISPTNSFLKKGVKSVVASLWKVADEPTEILMGYFYENLKKQMDKVDALRLAQVKLSQDPRFRHPNYWGAFVLYGGWK